MNSVLDYTRKLLYEHDCVVLPDLGGFLAYFSHAFYSEQNSLFHPPQKRVAFNEALKLDDGLLTHYLTINEQITRDEAQKRVRLFVDTIKNTVKETGTYALEGIGTLEMNAEGKLQFEPTPEINFYAEGFGLKSLQVTTLSTAVKVDSSESATDWTTADRAAEELPLEVPRRRRSRVAVYIGGILLIGSALVGGLMQVPSESLKSSLNPFELITVAKGWLAVDKKSNDVKSIVETPALETVKAADSKEVAVSEVAPKPAIEVEAPKVTAPAVKAEAKVATVQPVEMNSTSFKSDENPNFLVIAGGFSKLENARKLEAKLKRNGFENAAILNPEPAEGKLIIVTAMGCDNSQKAKAHLATVSRLAGSMAYVTHK
jgi:cell division septation protein DedD